MHSGTPRIHRVPSERRHLNAFVVEPRRDNTTGKTSGSCPGYVIAHVILLSRGGKNDPSKAPGSTLRAQRRGTSGSEWRERCYPLTGPTVDVNGPIIDGVENAHIRVSLAQRGHNNPSGDQQR